MTKRTNILTKIIPILSTIPTTTNIVIRNRITIVILIFIILYIMDVGVFGG